MTSLMTRSVVLFLCQVIVAQCRAKGLTISFDDYLAIVNGRYDNSDPDTDKDQDTVWIEARPALAPGLQKDPVLYIEEAINGKLYRMWIAARNDRSTGDILYISEYNFTDPSQHEPGTFTDDDLANLKRENFYNIDGCDASFEKMSETALLGQVMDCRHKVKNQHPSYALAITCDDFRVVPPVSAAETTTLAPYDLKHRGARYPLIDPPEGYVNPCSDDL